MKNLPLTLKTVDPELEEVFIDWITGEQVEVNNHPRIVGILR